MQALVIITCILLACSVIENKFKKNAKGGWRDVGMGLQWTQQSKKHQTKRKHKMKYKVEFQTINGYWYDHNSHKTLADAIAEIAIQQPV